MSINKYSINNQIKQSNKHNKRNIQTNINNKIQKMIKVWTKIKLKK